MKHRFLYILLLATVMISGCTDELRTDASGISEDVLDEGELTDATLNLTVRPYAVESQVETRASNPSETPETETTEEKEIHDIWVFQYDAETEQLLIKPRYYTITDQTKLVNLPVYLKAGIKSTVYVVANTGHDTWAKDDLWEEFRILDELKKQALPTAFPIRSIDSNWAIPMGGTSEMVTVIPGSMVEVPVSRLYAKLKVKVQMLNENMKLNHIDVQQIPNLCQVETLAGSSEPMEAVPFPIGTSFNSSAIAASDIKEDDGGESWSVFYVPENLQGETSVPSGGNKSDEVPDYALRVKITTEIDGTKCEYTAYPGGNTHNNFNIQRNQVYRLTVDIIGSGEQHLPSSNCFVVKPNGFLAFEPYYRVETGGGYNFSDYLNPDNPELAIDHVGIIWQTKDCIGDNTDGALVRLGENTDDIHRKIYVQTGAKGNALIAAYNKDDKIIWSWHIWVTDHEPDNIGKAVIYRTYAWDESGIHTASPRIQGYAVMSCNLGALADTQSKTTGGLQRYPSQVSQAFGMLYQWGRKDPFPPLRNIEYYHHDYNDGCTDIHYGNDNNTEVHKTSLTNDEYLFHSVIGSSLTGAVKYAIANPTVFICGTKNVRQSEVYVENSNNYFNKGDWCPEGESDNKLWGGLEPASEGMTAYSIANNVHLYDNYGDKKSIFDPCPTGWRVAPGELWLEFSKTGLNPGSMADINYDNTIPVSYGMSMYMQDWKKGPTSYFPTQGTRVGDGAGIRVGLCGNYHNATTDTNNRVNILHIHAEYHSFHIFEYDYFMYYVKSVAGPIRCVRDSK